MSIFRRIALHFFLFGEVAFGAMTTLLDSCQNERMGHFCHSRRHQVIKTTLSKTHMCTYLLYMGIQWSPFIMAKSRYNDRFSADRALSLFRDFTVLIFLISVGTFVIKSELWGLI